MTDRGRLCGALAIAMLVTDVAAQNPPARLNTIKDIGVALRACWVAPPPDQSRPGMQITAQMTFKHSGELFGKPRITFESPGASDDERLAYRVAVAEMIKRCTPLPFTEALGSAVAGRPFTMRFSDDRKLKQAENAP